MENGRGSTSTRARARVRVDVPPGRRGRPRHRAGPVTPKGPIEKLICDPPRYDVRSDGNDQYLVWDTFVRAPCHFTRRDGGDRFETRNAAARAADTLNAAYLEVIEP